MENQKCSYCGEKNISIRERVVELSEPFGGNSEVIIKEIVCNSCGFTEEDDANDGIILNSLSHLKQLAMTNILTSLNRDGYSNASMERALGLPSRTRSRWKKDNSISPSSSGIALMRIIRSFPWTLDIAENNFDYKKAMSIFLTNAMNEIVNITYEGGDWITSS